jgi:hypothetical protein
MQRVSATIPGATQLLQATRLDQLVLRPRAVLVGLVVVQWIAILAFALTVKHNGWLYHQGGDQLWYMTTGWLLGHGSLPPTFVSYWWSMLFAPIMLATGPEFLGALPIIILVNVLVLGPIALACVYFIARRIGGELLGLWCAALWVIVPFAAIPLFRQDYHVKYVELILPQAFGLTAMADFPSMVCLLVASVVLLRGLERRAPTEVLLAGVAAGVAVGVKPANLIFLTAPALAMLASRRFMLAFPFAVGLAPTFLALLLWKQRGLGSIPAFEGGGQINPDAAGGLRSYVDLDWGNLHENMSGLREWFWSARLLQWLPFAGLLAVARRSLPVAALLGGWFGAFLVIKGTTPLSTVQSGSFFRYLMPAFPAYFLLAASIPLLIPTLAARLERFEQPSGGRGLGARAVAVIAVAVITLPLAAAGLAQPIDSTRDALIVNNILIPVDPEIDVVVTAQGEARTIVWNHPSTNGTSVFYRVFRTALAGPDTVCKKGTGAINCALNMIELTTTRQRRYVDGSPPPGARYRIGVAANWLDDSAGGDVFAVSPPVAATP